MIQVDRSYPIFIFAKRVWQRRLRLRLRDRVRDTNGLDWILVGRTTDPNARLGFYLFAAGLMLRPEVGVEFNDGFELLELDVTKLAKILLEYQVQRDGIVLHFAKLMLPNDEPMLFA